MLRCITGRQRIASRLPRLPAGGGSSRSGNRGLLNILAPGVGREGLSLPVAPYVSGNGAAQRQVGEGRGLRGWGVVYVGMGVDSTSQPDNPGRAWTEILFQGPVAVAG
ncbi:hypothetical protein PLESTB_001757700 [Pleodorina starrii]|uniref:Uncharacterized protein n=1 Tax=Pleodorina starrii TaxID=330485 RepID=A0A9W6C108_9CHLO|nr:hypothetical protein PLESTM_000599300 [Pleodorina starrii]GLC61450.1 hypothetical protein PLESTB_001757700 [Pleodorina starrii]